MSSILTILLAVIAVASATNPYVGYPIPFYLNYTSGATEATRNAYPYQASLQWGLRNHTHFCSGAILSSLWVVTSAHCASVVPPYGNFVVKVGKHDLTVAESTEQTISVKQIIVHENFTGDLGYHDIALLKLSKPINLNSATKAIALSNTSSPSGSGAMLSWGSTWRMYTPRVPDKLQTSPMTVITNAKCVTILHNITTSSAAPGSWQFCTAPQPGAFSACDSEPGAPFVQYYGSNGPYLMGVASWGVIPCAITEAPLVFTHIYLYKTWITAKQNSN